MVSNPFLHKMPVLVNFSDFFPDYSVFLVSYDWYCSGALSLVGWLVGFVALRPKSTAMVIAGRSVHLTTLFSWAGLNKRLTSNCAHTFACN